MEALYPYTAMLYRHEGEHAVALEGRSTNDSPAACVERALQPQLAAGVPAPVQLLPLRSGRRASPSASGPST